MAQDSKRKRHMRKLKREATAGGLLLKERERANAYLAQLQQLGRTANYFRMTLLSVLAQQGGSVVVTKGTVEQITDRHYFDVGKGATPDEMVVTLRVQEAEPVANTDPKPPAFTMETIPDDEGDGIDHSHEVSRFHDEGNPNDGVEL